MTNSSEQTTAASEALAINGGTPVRAEPMPQRHLFGNDEKQAVADLFDRAMRHGDHVLGYHGEQEEAYGREFAAFLGGGYADGVNSGTNALYVALRALEIEPGSEVIVPPISDPGGVMPVPLCNLIPIVADAAPGSYNVGAAQIASRITEQTRAILVAHIAGIPCDMDEIMTLAGRHHLRVIEDCAQAPGATYRNQPTGTMGDVAAFSLMFGKHHASGGQGGMVFTRDQNLYWKVRQHADRGKPFGIDKPTGNVVAALNCNMDELHACIGRVQLAKLPAMVARRRASAKKLAEGCAERLKAVRLMGDPPHASSAYWFLLFELDLAQLRVDKATWVAALQAEGVPCATGYWHVPGRMPWHRERAVFGSSGLPWQRWETTASDRQPDLPPLPNIEATEARCMMLPFHEAWGAREVSDVLDAMAKVEAAYCISAR